MIHPTNNKTVTQKIIWHLLVFLIGVFIALIFSLILRRKLVHNELPEMVIMTFVQLELFIWLGTLFFQSIKIDQPKYARRIVGRLLVFYLSVLGISLLMFIGIYTFHFIKNGADFSLYFTSLTSMELKSFFIATLVGFALGAVFFFYTQWSEALQRLQKLKEEKLIFQYETLKNQVNPHFLFNSLNSLSLLVRSDADLAEEFIQKLSLIYRNILDNTEKELVPLSTEIELVKNFFYLQKVRDGNKVELEIEFDKFDNIMVLPVSLQILVENALKHNSATHNQPLEIAIHFEGIDKLVVRNNLQKKMQMNDSSKIGLRNLNERSRLILNQEIEINKTRDEFVVKIPVKLK